MSGNVGGSVGDVSHAHTRISEGSVGRMKTVMMAAAV